MIIRFFPLSLFASCLVFAQPSVDLQQAFLDLRHDGVLMCISAHPDDEDGSSLAYYRLKYGAKTYSVFLTRGEGGQNEKGPELYEDLGVLRTVETHAAGEIQGTDVYFLNFMDFGYSKSATETFQKWGRSEVLRRLVFIIRKLKPDVLFSNMNTIDGHGHHQVAAIATIAAFDAAADSTFAPEQLQLPGITLWQPKKFFIRVRTDISAGGYDVVNNILEVNETRNAAYIDIATSGLRMHKTQGMDRAELRRSGFSQTLYKLMRSNSLYDRDTTTFFGGIDFWNDHSTEALAPVRSAFTSLKPGMPRDSLLMVASSVLAQIESLHRKGGASPLAGRMLSHWKEELERLVQLTCSISFTLTPVDPIVVPRQRVNWTLDIHSADCSIGGVKYGFEMPAGWFMSEALEIVPTLNEKKYTREFALTAAEAPLFTLPRAVAQYRGIETDESVVATARCLVAGYPFTFSTRAIFDVAPPQQFSITPKVTRIASSQLSKGKVFGYAIKNFRPGDMAGQVTIQGPSGWKAESSPYRIQKEDSTARGSITVRPAAGTPPGEYTVKFKTEFTLQEAMVKVFDAAVAGGMKVGIIKSQDNTLEAVSKELGISYKLLDENDMEGDLSKYKTIVIDIRAYLVREDLKKENARVLEYVQGGGNLVVMYQRPQEWKPEYAPYPFQISGRRVTVEEAPMDILDQKHPLMTRPNIITDADWVGWKQERAVYFPTGVPMEYTHLLSSHDPDDAPLATGYLVANYGKGTYIYTSYVWYRQLKEMHPGAFRCFANMISYPAYRK